MTEIYTENGYTIWYNEDDGNYAIEKHNKTNPTQSGEIIGVYVSDSEARERLEDILYRKRDNRKDILPVKSTTLKAIREKYNDYVCNVYILHYEGNNNGPMFAGSRGKLVDIDSGELAVFGDAVSAKISKYRRTGSYSIWKFKLENGKLKK